MDDAKVKKKKERRAKLFKSWFPSTTTAEAQWLIDLIMNPLRVRTTATRIFCFISHVLRNRSSVTSSRLSCPSSSRPSRPDHSPVCRNGRDHLAFGRGRRRLRRHSIRDYSLDVLHYTTLSLPFGSLQVPVNWKFSSHQPPHAPSIKLHFISIRIMSFHSYKDDGYFFSCLYLSHPQSSHPSDRRGEMAEPKSLFVGEFVYTEANKWNETFRLAAAVARQTRYNLDKTINQKRNGNRRVLSVWSLYRRRRRLLLAFISINL